MNAYVGIDLHRRRWVAVCLTEEGDRLWWRRFDNSAENLAPVVAEAGPEPDVVLEATFGWYWAADVITEEGGRVHLAHPLGIKGFENRRVKNDIRDAELLADLLRMGRLPEAWIPPKSTRELRELVRYRHRLNQLRSGLKSQIHGVLGKEGVIPELKWLWGPGGDDFLNQLELAEAYGHRVESLRDLIVVYDTEIKTLDRLIHEKLKDDSGYKAILPLTGGPKEHRLRRLPWSEAETWRFSCLRRLLRG
jgi:transposase